VTGFGEKLRREREMRGVSLEEIAESTKIGTRNLRALEQEDFDKLPGGIFNKGFVRAYSRFLGLDEEQTVSDFDVALKEHQAVKGQAEIIQIAEEPETERFRRFVFLLAALVIIAIIGITWYLVRRHHNARDERARHETIGESPRTSTPSNQIAASAGAAPTRPAQAIATTPSKTASETTSETGKSSSGSISDSKISPSDAVDRAKDSAAPIRLDVTAHEDSWLSIFADGKSLGQEILAAQKSRTIRAQKEVRLKLGNVAGVEVSFNGKPVNIDGEPKQVKEFTFTADGLRQ